MFLSVDCAVNKKAGSNLPWDFTKNVKRLSLEFRTLLVPNVAISARVFQGVIFSRFQQANLKKGTEMIKFRGLRGCPRKNR